MNDKEISEQIAECLLNEGYGRTAAMLQVSEITKAVFRWAFELGAGDTMADKLLIFGLREKIKELEDTKSVK
jgi:hypothetical protein